MNAHYGISTPRHDGATIMASFTVPLSNCFGVICFSCKQFAGPGTYHECWSDERVASVDTLPKGRDTK